MSKELVEAVFNSYVQEIGSGAGKTIRAWTPAEIELAEYAAELQAENARLEAALAETAAQLVDAVQRVEELEAGSLYAAQKRIASLESWIREHGDRSNTCTYDILNKEICDGCLCGRK